MAVDLDLSLAGPAVPGLEFRQADILAGPVEPGGFDLVTARAVLHHVGDAGTAVANLVASARPGGTILLIEPDFLPVSIAEPAPVHAFWQGWLAWSRAQGIDYFIGRRLPAMLSGLGVAGYRGHGPDRGLQRRLRVGRILAGDDHRAAPPAAGLRPAGQPVHRQFPGPVHRPGLVDPDHRLHRHARAQAGVRTAPAPRGAAPECAHPLITR